MQSDTKVSRVTKIVPCGKHGAPRGNPCWSIESITGTASPAVGICDERARRAGMVGKISRKSIVRAAVPASERAERFVKKTKQEGLGDAFKKVGKAAGDAAKAFRGINIKN